MFHRLPDRICAYASICFMALIIHRIIRQRLKDSSGLFSSERALETLRRIKRHRITLNDKTHTGISTLSDEQGELLGSLNVDKPNESKQLSLLK